ncbi:MAG: hypothetical protein DRN14_01095 [Thermoplasmata archaeon]|nr:MAG: hypothetical protein DRN14_01095 [Thermoplasmata archaeon]
MRLSNHVPLILLLVGAGMGALEQTSKIAPFLVLPSLILLFASLRARPGLAISFLSALSLASLSSLMARESTLLSSIFIAAVGLVLYHFGETMHLDFRKPTKTEVAIVAIIIVLSGISIFAFVRRGSGYVEMYFVSPPSTLESGQSAVIRVAIANHFGEEKSLILRAYLDGTAILTKTLTLGPDEERIVQIALGRLDPGDHELEVLGEGSWGSLKLKLNLEVVG